MKYNGYLGKSLLVWLLIFVIWRSGAMGFSIFLSVFTVNGSLRLDPLWEKGVFNDNSIQVADTKLLNFKPNDKDLEENQLKDMGLKVRIVENSHLSRVLKAEEETPEIFNIRSEKKISWEDSEKTQKNGEDEGKTKAQREYENRITKLKSSLDPKVRAKGERLEATYQVLKNSAVTFHVVINDSGRGELTYEGVEGHLFINISGKTGFEDIPIVCQIAHEFKHAEQFLNGNLGFYRNDRGKWVGWRDDNFDEAEAFMAHFDAEEGDESTIFLKTIKNSIPFGVYAVANVLENNQNSPRIYRNRGVESVPVSSILTPRHYAIPKKTGN